MTIKEDTLIVCKSDFVLFMVDAINYTAQTDKKTEKIKIIVKAAEKYLGIKGLGRDTVEKMLSGGATSSQTWDGDTVMHEIFCNRVQEVSLLMVSS